MRWKTAAAATWSLLIVVATAVPSSGLPETDLVGVDKLVHIALFLGFAWLWLAASQGNWRRAAYTVLAGGLLLAGFTEVLQGLLPLGRHASLADAAADAVGLFFGIGSFRGLAAFFGRESRG